MATLYNDYVRNLAYFLSDHCSNNAYYFRDKGGAWNFNRFEGDDQDVLASGFRLYNNVNQLRFNQFDGDFFVVDNDELFTDGEELIRKDMIDGRAPSSRLSEPLARRGKIINTIYGVQFASERYPETKTINVADGQIFFPRSYFGFQFDNPFYKLDASKEDETGTYVFDGTDYNIGDWVSWIKIDVTQESGFTGEEKSEDVIRITFLPFRSLEALEEDLDTDTDCGSCLFCGCLATWVSTYVGYFPTGVGLRTDGVHIFDDVKIVKTSDKIVNKHYLDEIATNFAKSNRVLISKYTVRDEVEEGEEESELRDAEAVVDDTVEVIEGEFIKNEWFEKYKVSGGKHSTVISQHGSIYVFYEKNNNISVAMSKDNGETWFDFDGIVRLKFGENAKYPLVVSHKMNDEVFLFYTFNDSLVCSKRVLLSDFIIEDAFVDYVPILEFEVGTVDSAFTDEYENAGLEQFSLQGKRIRKSQSHIVMGSYYNTGDFNLIDELEVSSGRREKGLSYRFETIVAPADLHKEFNEDVKRVTYNAFIDNNGAIWFFYSLNENAFSYIDKTLCANPEDCSIDKGCNPDSYTPADASRLGFNLFQIRKGNRSLLSWPKTFSNLNLFDSIFPCEEGESSEGEPSIHRFCRQGHDGIDSYKMQFDVLYDKYTDHFYIMVLGRNRSVWIRRWMLDTVRRLEGFIPDPCFDKSCSTSLKDQSASNFVFRNYLQINGDLPDINPRAIVQEFFVNPLRANPDVAPAMFLTARGRLKLYYVANSQLISISTSSDPTIKYVQTG